jgi:c-di-GMP-binding flagellar brake protein YcgR
MYDIALQRCRMIEHADRSAYKDFMRNIKDYIGINEILQVRILEDKNATTHYSRVNDLSEGRLVISWPTQLGVRLLVHRDQMLQFHYMHNEVPHEFIGLVDEMNTEPLPEITVILSSTIARVQRRQNFRIKVMIPVEITGTLKDPKDNTVIALNIHTVTCDLSGSGMAIRNHKMIPEGSLLEIKLSLPDNAPVIKLPCSVEYSENQGDNHTMYRTGIHYLTISESERARIVRFIYQTQLKGVHP